MKKFRILLNLFFALFISSNILGQKINIPVGVNYKYCDTIIIKNAINKITSELSENPKYNLDLGITFIGPTLWSRIKNDKNLSKIKGGDMIIKGVDKKNPTGKATANKDDFKLVWDYVRNEIGQSKFSFRKASYDELNYYWYIISFDIEEPLFVVYTEKHNYLINLDPKELKITWLDEIPKK